MIFITDESFDGSWIKYNILQIIQEGKNSSCQESEINALKPY